MPFPIVLATRIPDFRRNFVENSRLDSPNPLTPPPGKTLTGNEGVLDILSMPRKN